MTKPSSKSASDAAPLAITIGEPAGVGPELVLQLVSRQDTPRNWIAVGDRDLLGQRASALDLQIELLDAQAPLPRSGACLRVHHVALPRRATPGRLDPGNAAAVVRTLDVAIEGCRSGRFAGVVTAPVQKSVINDAGIPFTGHTEYLRDGSGVEDVVMMLVADRLRVALATTHLPLRAVPDAISRALLCRRLGIVHRALIDQFRIADPRILVAGLNPHAGESGHLGREEIEVIAPAIAELAATGMRLRGPLPADTLFTPAQLANADAVMAMYHDQGLPVLKYAAFGRGVNVTLGLPFVRTSVDHGTALDIAGRGVADSGSLAEAIQLAEMLVA
ncbi:MAG: 4-hydroxythreonine-4-phosphate dehydrogenase PdxA [Pseudomonadales bacterium]|nr:4-hydroxythreonine-4-phosphate dehydrogenase PdxA [Pseudomonadales bacterium]MCP5185422.1 4-hydroxythreonine-4-phosphate dehydrogenase PdxA [Pseudomonadales bacterium]